MSLSVGPGFLWLSLVSSVTVIVMLARALGLAYLFSLLRIGDGVTRKSRREDTIVEARLGNFTDSLPIDCNDNKGHKISLINTQLKVKQNSEE